MYKSVVEAESISVNLRAEIGRRAQSVSQLESNKIHELKCRIKHLQDKRAKFAESLNKGLQRFQSFSKDRSGIELWSYNVFSDLLQTILACWWLMTAKVNVVSARVTFL